MLAAHTAPLSRDGMRENVLLGTYGHELFMYAPAPALLAPAVALSGRIAFEAPIYALLSVKLHVSYLYCLPANPSF